MGNDVLQYRTPLIQSAGANEFILGHGTALLTIAFSLTERRVSTFDMLLFLYPELSIIDERGCKN